MSKPILSELEYNASDVASAILEKADLSVTNQDFGVADKSSIFIDQTNVSSDNFHAYSFNGFMFLSGRIVYTGTPSHSTNLIQINDSDYYPTANSVTNILGYEGDTASMLLFLTDGQIQVKDPVGTGSESNWLVTFTHFYRFT